MHDNEIRRKIMLKAKPHIGYEVLLDIVNSPRIKDYFVITSNVDGLFIATIQ